MSEGLSGDLRRKQIAASTIREALGGYISEEPWKIITSIAKGNSSLEFLLEMQAQCKAYYRLRKELELAMSKGQED